MVLSWDLVNLFLYCAQQLGVMMGVGAEVVLLFSYLTALRDGVVEPAEERMARAVHRVLNTGLALIILSGAAITAIHFMAGEMSTILEPAYLFKWALIGFALVFTVGVNIKWPLTFIEGIAGGAWLALFLVHVLAPVTTWTNLLELFAVWMAGFLIIWIMLVFSLRGKAGKAPAKPAPLKMPKAGLGAPIAQPAGLADMPKKPLFNFFAKKPKEGAVVITPTAAPKPAAPAPAPRVIPVPIPPPPQPMSMPIAPLAEHKLTPPAAAVSTVRQDQTPSAHQAANPNGNPELPVIQVMPKSQGDVANQTRATVIEPGK